MSLDDIDDLFPPRCRLPIQSAPPRRNHEWSTCTYATPDHGSHVRESRGIRPYGSRSLCRCRSFRVGKGLALPTVGQRFWNRVRSRGKVCPKGMRWAYLHDLTREDATLVHEEVGVHLGHLSSLD